VLVKVILLDYCCVNLVAEAGDISETERKGTSAVGSCYQATTNEDCNTMIRSIVSCNDL
jgi:hypothetical protein